MTPFPLPFLLIVISTITFLPLQLHALDQTPGGRLLITAREDGRYSIAVVGNPVPVLQAGAAVKINGAWLRVADYPKHSISKNASAGGLGPAEDWTIIYSGLKSAPDLSLNLRAYQNQPFGELQVTITNTTGKSIKVDGIRAIEGDAGALNLGGSHADERVLSDSFSEDRPGMKIHDFTDPVDGMHRAIGSQIVYNLANHRSWFIGALSSDKFLTVLRLHVSSKDLQKLDSYEIESTGTIELLNDNSLKDSQPQDHVMLSLPLEPAASLSSERILFSVADDPVHQLETYGRLIRELHHARATAPVPLGWWSWTVYYFGLNEGTALTNAQWLAQNLKQYGYSFFHIDEGYQFARGEYATPDADLFPHGLTGLERKITNLGLTPGIWTAPFEVSERSWVFTHHPEWLVKNDQGAPIHIGTVSNKKDHIYALDTTNPDAQQYLRETYTTLTRAWNIRYIKLDFMEDSAVEGYYHQPNTTALEAQRIGLQVIREAVCDSVLLDKDGCEMLNPVGIVDMGRISQDTGHSFSSSKNATTGIAARFFMNRNCFIADPDAFSISTQTLEDRAGRGGRKPLTSDEAMVSVVLSAVSGGLFEIGDDLPRLWKSPDRLAWLKNQDLLDMVHLGRAATPIDLLTYEKDDLEPSIFVLKESNHQTIVAIFNWTESPRSHDLSVAQLGLDKDRTYNSIEVLDPTTSLSRVQRTLHVTQPPHSVRLIKLLDNSTQVEAVAPRIVAPSGGKTGENIEFSSDDSDETNPVLMYRWDFGDGTTVEGQHVTHAFTRAGNYDVTLTVVGPAEASTKAKFPISVTGSMSTQFNPETKRRLPLDEQ